MDHGSCLLALELGKGSTKCWARCPGIPGLFLTMKHGDFIGISHDKPYLGGQKLRLYGEKTLQPNHAELQPYSLGYGASIFLC